MRELDDLEQRAVVEVRLGDDQLVDVAFGEDLGQLGEPAEERQGDPVRRRPDCAEEVVGDPASASAERTAQMLDAVAVTDEDRAPPDAGETE